MGLRRLRWVGRGGCWLRQSLRWRLLRAPDACLPPEDQQAHQRKANEPDQRQHDTPSGHTMAEPATHGDLHRPIAWEAARKSLFASGFSTGACRGIHAGSP